MRIGVIVGMRSESACLPRDRDRLLVRCCGARPAVAAAMAVDLIDAGCQGLVSFGCAGGLDPALIPGTVVIAESVRLPDGQSLATDPSWRQRLMTRIDNSVPIVCGVVAAAHEPLLGAQIKRFCHHASGAVAVDMESGEIGAAATARGVPLLVVRAIADPAECSIPAWIAELVTEDGKTPIGAVLQGLLKHPHDLGLLIRLGRDARAAMRSLRGVAIGTGPVFQFDG